MKNLPQRERQARRARSTYSQATPHRAPKVPYKYPSWVTEGRAPPEDIATGLSIARHAERVKDERRRFLRRKVA